ncbi:MAG TPA: hypothetical protein VGE13_03375 [Candidatus Saccharimonadales bacterium]
MPEEPKSNPLPSPEANIEPASPNTDEVSKIDIEETPSRADPMSFPSSEIEPPTGTGLVEISTPNPESSQSHAITDETSSQSPVQANSFEQSGVVLPETPAKKSGKKKFIIAGVVVGILALLGGGGALAYTVWNQSPDKVIMDGLANLLTDAPKGMTLKADYQAEDVKLALSVDAKSNEKMRDAKIVVNFSNSKENIELTASANTLTKTQDGVMYLKLNDIREPIEKAIGMTADKQQVPFGLNQGNGASNMSPAAQKAKLLKQIDPIITKIDNKWIKINAKSSSDDVIGGMQKCVNDLVKKVETNKAVRDEIIRAYSGNRFIVVKEQLGVKDGSYGYVLGFDETKASGFIKALDSTQFAAGMNKCLGGSGRPDLSDGEVAGVDDNFKDSRFELWVSQGAHQITGVNARAKLLNGESESTVKINTAFSYESATVPSEPTDAIDAESVMQEIQALTMQNMMPGTATTLPVSPTPQPVTNRNTALREMIIRQYRANNRGLQPSEAEIEKILKEYNTSDRV